MNTLVYVSGPITDHPQGPWMGVRDACDVGKILLDAGYAPHIPHLSHFWDDARPDHDLKYEQFLDIDLAVVPRCDALIRLPGKSAGSDREVQAATSAGIPVFFDLTELLDQLPVNYADDTDPNVLRASHVPYEEEYTAKLGADTRARDWEREARSYAANADYWRQRYMAVADGSWTPDMDSAELPGPIRDALDRIRGTFASKNADYANTVWDSNFRDVAGQMGWSGPLESAEALIAVKQARLRSLRVNGTVPKNESTFDTVLDRAVYSVIALAILTAEET